MTSEPVWLAGDGLRLRADAWGPMGGDPILFFHGGGQSRRSWAGAAARLGEAGFRSHSVDLRGHGGSDWSTDGDYALDAYARDVAAILDTLDRPAVLVGASRGGQAALVGGSRRPDRVRLVLLADVTPTIRDAGVDRIRGFFEASRAGFTDEAEAAATLDRFMGGERSGGDPVRLRRTLRERQGRLYWHWDPRTVSPAFIHPPSDPATMEEVARTTRLPVVLVRGARSDLVRPEDVAAFRTMTPQLRVHEAAGVGHMLTGDTNDVFADVLLDELART